MGLGVAGTAALTAYTAHQCFHDSGALDSFCSNTLGRDFLSAEDTGIVYSVVSGVLSLMAATCWTAACCFLRNR